MKCNGREAVTNFEPALYDVEMMSEAECEGSALLDNSFLS